jgi:hypothetical protein
MTARRSATAAARADPVEAFIARAGSRCCGEPARSDKVLRQERKIRRELSQRLAA